MERLSGSKLIRYPRLLADHVKLYVQARLASRYGARHALPGTDFGDFGRRMWFRLLLRGDRTGVAYTLTPVKMAASFQEYPTWEGMPGMGVCGLMIEKP
jgi:hypothetical protein